MCEEYENSIKKLGREIPNDVKVLYLGVIREDTINKKTDICVKYCLLPVKKAITKNWYKPEPPSLKQWMHIINIITKSLSRNG